MKAILRGIKLVGMAILFPFVLIALSVGAAFEKPEPPMSSVTEDWIAEKVEPL